MDKTKINAAIEAYMKMRQASEARHQELERNVALANYRAGYALGAIQKASQQKGETNV